MYFLNLSNNINFNYYALKQLQRQTYEKTLNILPQELML